MNSSNAVRTLVLVGRTGNGKSATGNSILQEKAFWSTLRSTGVTKTSQMRKAKLEDGLSLNVIDTPGLFDPSAKASFISQEIVKCIRMAEDGIHAFLIVLSLKNRFSFEEEKAFPSLKELFGNKVVDYAIIVFTNGDELEANDQTLDDYLESNSTGPLKEVLQMCGNRFVVFNNRARHKSEKDEQLSKLLSLVNKVVEKNDGQPYTNELFVQFQVESKVKEAARRMDEKLAKVQAESNRRLAEEQAESARRVAEALAESKRQIEVLTEKIERITKPPSPPASKSTDSKGSCTIL